MAVNKTRVTVIGVAVLLIGAGGLYLKSNQSKTPAVEYQTQAAARGLVRAQVTASGTLSPVVTVQVGSQVSGRIVELGADFNSEVKKGQVLARLDPLLFESDVTKSKANLRSAQANLTKALAQERDAKLQFERTRSLADKGVVPRAELDTQQATYESAKATVVSSRAALEQARAAVEQSETNLGYATITSPIDGVVISRDVDVGQTVAASLQAPTLFTIAEDLRKMEVHTSVAESDVGRIHSGQPALFTVDAYPDERFRGTVKQVRYSPTSEQNVVTYDAVVEVDNAELKLRPGMTANVTFVVAEADDALLVPNAALRFSPPPEVVAQLQTGETGPARTRAGRAPGTERGQRHSRQRHMVWVPSETGPRPVEVEIGISDGSMTQIVAGELTEGSEVLVGTGKAGEAAAPGPGNRPGNRSGGNRRFGRIL